MSRYAIKAFVDKSEPLLRDASNDNELAKVIDELQSMKAVFKININGVLRYIRGVGTPKAWIEVNKEL